ncbi:MAG TPA: hypothetical protein VN634_13865 [Candidatus Limnocylindrales bacterium]|jgi:hypothetical protein|nr:hypothetical protein [Candidatus Limnocylindrales bacterium]
MTTNVTIRIDNETWLSLEAISECYECEVTWLREAYEFGLLGGGRVYSGTIVLSVRVLDRVAEIVRLGRYQGMSFETIFVLLGDEPVCATDE